MLLHSQEQNNGVLIVSKVFIGGSRRLSKLNKQIKQRLDSVINKGLKVIVGDANGTDKAVQTYLAHRNYENVAVFCMAGICRNNVGNWPTRVIVGHNGSRDAAFFGMKDRAMGAEADYGFMLWDGKSRGTLANIKDLIGRQKPVVVYLASKKSFLTLRTLDELTSLLDRLRPTPSDSFTASVHGRHSNSHRGEGLF
jgi:hypothetical protein